MPELKQSHLDLLRDFENELENRAKFPDPKKSEKFKRIIEILADPKLYKFMKDAVYSDSYTHSKAKNFLRKYFKKNYNKMLQAAQNQVKDLLEKYMKIVSSSSEEQKKQLIKSLKIMLDNITYGLSIDPKFPSDVKPLAEQIEAVSREIFELRTPKAPEETNLDYYRNRIVAAYESLTEIRTAANGKKYTDLEIITKDPSPVTTAFKKAYYAVSNALFMITSPSLLMRTQDSNVSNRHSFFWKPPSDNLKKSVKDVEEDLHLTTPKKPR